LLGASDDKFETALHHLSGARPEEAVAATAAVQWLLFAAATDADTRRALVLRCDGYGRTPLSLAARHGLLGIVEALLGAVEAAAERAELVNKVDRNGYSALIKAVQYDHAAIVERLLAAGASALLHEHEHGQIALHAACYKGHEQCTALLLGEAQPAAQLTSVEVNENTPLHLTIIALNKVLLAKPAPANQAQQAARLMRTAQAVLRCAESTVHGEALRAALLARNSQRQTVLQVAASGALGGEAALLPRLRALTEAAWQRSRLLHQRGILTAWTRDDGTPLSSFTPSLPPSHCHWASHGVARPQRI